MPKSPIPPTDIPTVAQVRANLEALADAEIAKNSAWFFKTGPGEYGEGDRFRGIRVPVLRKLVKDFRALPHDVARGGWTGLCSRGSLFAAPLWHDATHDVAVCN